MNIAQQNTSGNRLEKQVPEAEGVVTHLEHTLPRRESLRVEKGTMKVDDHEVKEEAATLLSACLSILEFEDHHVRAEFSRKLTTVVPDVIAKFGFDLKRIQTAGVKYIETVNNHFIREQELGDLKGKAAKLLNIIDTLTEEATQLSSSAGLGGTQPSLGPRGERVTTRNRMVSKRTRQDAELEEVCKDIFSSVKRLRSEDDSNK